MVVDQHIGDRIDGGLFSAAGLGVNRFQGWNLLNGGRRFRDSFDRRGASTNSHKVSRLEAPMGLIVNPNGDRPAAWERVQK